VYDTLEGQAYPSPIQCQSKHLTRRVMGTKIRPLLQTHWG